MDQGSDFICDLVPMSGTHLSLAFFVVPRAPCRPRRSLSSLARRSIAYLRSAHYMETLRGITESLLMMMLNLPARVDESKTRST